MKAPNKAAPASTQVHLRLIRATETPTSHELDEPYLFGLQDTKQNLIPGVRQPDGSLVFDFTLTAKPGSDPLRPVFTGPFASGPADDRFVYLSWRSIPRGVWINRIKARLAAIDWKLIHAARKAGQPLVADMSGWSPGMGRRQVEWSIARA